MAPEVPLRPGTLARTEGETPLITCGLAGYVFITGVGEGVGEWPTTWDGELARVVERPRAKASLGLTTVLGLPAAGSASSALLPSIDDGRAASCASCPSIDDGRAASRADGSRDAGAAVLLHRRACPLLRLAQGAQRAGRVAAVRGARPDKNLLRLRDGRVRPVHRRHARRQRAAAGDAGGAAAVPGFPQAAELSMAAARATRGARSDGCNVGARGAVAVG
eukprot:CAMPEP_0175773378 /NCGR_PEP_ID=MMETSP0097-20121207/73051_1 /TAXON_ID=311494 /ORGANISM="Alexandrium monilatum, Strain CCMP3105" /LENGTH=220 /DNA_ID=CAMNT_0017083795 /DNA_START=115 /DNA_END=776 /DNA_ORIENTATION=+